MKKILSFFIFVFVGAIRGLALGMILRFLLFQIPTSNEILPTTLQNIIIFPTKLVTNLSDHEGLGQFLVILLFVPLCYSGIGAILGGILYFIKNPKNNPLSPTL